MQEPLDFKKAVITGLLGTGRIVSTVALVNQGMQGTFSLFHLNKHLSEILSILAGASNGVSNGITRLKAIYDNLSSKEPITADKLSRNERAVVYIIMGSGGLTLAFLVLNTFSAIIQLECNSFGDKGCHNGFHFPAIWYYLPAAIIGSVSSGYAYSAYVFNIIKKHAINFVKYFSHFKHNLKEENKFVLCGTAILGLLNSLSLGATLYFSTSKMIFNLWGPDISQYKIIQSQIYISVITALISNIFSAVADGKNLLEGKSLGSLQEWFCGNSTLSTTLLAPVLLIDTLSHALNNYPGNIEILNKFLNGHEDIKTVIAIANSLNTAFLYFAFNTRRAFNIVANVDAQKENNAPLLSKYGIFNNPDYPDNEKSINNDIVIEQKPSKSCHCVIL